MSTKFLIPIKDLHPTALENIKTSTKIFTAHLKERLRYKDYDGLTALMDIKRENEYFDHDIIKGILFYNDDRALEIIMLGIIKHTPHYYTMSRYTMLGYLAKKLIQKPDLRNLEKLLQELSKTKLDISSFDLFKYLREEEDLNDIIKANMFGKSSRDIKVKMAKAFVLAIHKQSGTKLTMAHLEELSHYLNKEEFYTFVEDEGIDLSRFDIKFEHYDLETIGTLLAQAAEIKTIEDIMLQGTYSNHTNLPNIRQIYKELFADKNPYVRDTMTMLALGVVEKDGIKVFFSNNQTAESYYSPYANIIEVGLTMVGSDLCLSIPSVTIHEAGHYAYEALYGSHGTPLDFKDLKKAAPDFNKLKHALNDDYYGYTGMRNALGIQDNPRITFTNLVAGVVSQLNLTAIDQAFLQLQKYEEGPKLFLSHALKLLQIENADKELNRYFDTEEFIEWTKANVAALDLFIIDSVYKYEKEQHFNASHSIYLNAQYSYQQGLGSNICPTNTTAFHTKSALEAIVDFKFHVLESLVKNYNLTQHHICFLERAADFVNRHSNDFDKEENGPYSNDLGIYQELVVRCPEFISLGLNSELIESACKQVFAYHDEYIAPDIRARVDNYRSKCMVLDSLDIAHNETSLEVLTSLAINSSTSKMNVNTTNDSSVNSTSSIAKRHCDIFFDWYDV